MTAGSESSPRPAEAAPWRGAAAVGLVLLTLSFAALHLPLLGELRIVDTPVYQLYGERIAAGEAPYADFRLEYPPAALIVFWLPTVGPADDYAAIFEVLMWMCGAAAIVALAGTLAALNASSRRLYGAVAFAGIAPLLLGPVVLSRFDLWPAALLAAALAAFVSGRETAGWSALAAAVAAKLYPLAVLPLALGWAARRLGGRRALLGLGAFLLTLAALVVPFALVSPGGLADSLGRQLGRPLQVESLGASFLLAAHQLGWYEPTVVSSYGSQNLAGSLPDALAAASSVVQAGAIVAVWAFALRDGARSERLALASAAAVTAFIAFGKVLSPQFLIWLIPLVPLVGGRAGVRAAALLGAALVATQVWFPTRYWDMVALGPEAWIVLARDLLLVALFGVLLRALASRDDPVSVSRVSRSGV